jgi:hypothetical protein
MAALLLPLLSSPALACAVCSDPNDVRAAVYFDMTMFLSLAPLGFVGFGAWYIWRRMQEQGT